MTVESKPLKSTNTDQSVPTAWAPISRRYIDYTHKPTRVILGLVLVLYSAWATIFVVGGAFPDVAWWHSGVGYAVGAALAATISLVEIQLGERNRFGYLVVVAIDAFLTQQYSAWAGDLLHSAIKIEDANIEKLLVAAIVLLAAGATAYFGERLLFGRRRKMR